MTLANMMISHTRNKDIDIEKLKNCYILTMEYYLGMYGSDGRISSFAGTLKPRHSRLIAA